MMKESFLAEFPPVSTEAWEQAIAADLKGGDAAKLTWHAEEGLAVKPFYRAEDVAGLGFLDAAPGEFPYVRGARAAGGWLIREEVDAGDAEEANRAARNAVAAGAEEIAFLGAKLESAADLAMLLSGLEGIPVHFDDERAVRLLMERLRTRPHGALISSGANPLADLELTAQVLRDAPAGWMPFTIRAEEFQERGATAAEEAGFALAAGVDLLAEMRARGIGADGVADAVGFSFAMGPEFFVQMAKLRAFRMVWARAVESFGGSRAHARTHIVARTARWNRTVYDPHGNVLRATTEALSAVLGGADSICVAPFDECYPTPEEASRRLARNTQILLKLEAQLGRVADAGGGSYFVEALTDRIAAGAWKALRDVEAAGGYGKAAAAGTIERTLQQRMQARERDVASRRRVLTGTNRFADATERALSRVEPAKTDGRRRAGEWFERLRLRTERHAMWTGGKPRILLAEIGDAKMRAARSQFAADFLACAGLETQAERFANAEEIAARDAELIVLCSSDAEYLALATELRSCLKARGKATPVMVAGNPETAAQLGELGVAQFIHLRSNALEALAEFEQRMGIED
ncbi:MAG TPA: methylmalonyl-CoA mutase family protein [Terracidiphilus sp.]|jgi:methylmalonyl-CoA mutase|nr:methylmalonyl-CoA mutase family protein [Terracidiphilus sp.]